VQLHEQLRRNVFLFNLRVLHNFLKESQQSSGAKVFGHKLDAFPAANGGEKSSLGCQIFLGA
jgi:hypothetical protein